ncbi:cell division ATP-binding protein FtsE [Neofamilia massiliensis]|uniref:cell division ATP-binding protein FtsE n=1 Tax=Neofamilia massiliensis TaxID=1673724 RepID=UPI0006BB5F55|nr:cell division ATP-binding protein FtsE [Neofamilia massiliensis]
MIRLENVLKKYDNGVIALNNINLNIKLGEFVFLIGPSGAGKSTLLKLLSHEELPTKGSIFIDNINITKLSRRQVPFHRRKLGIVFQDFKLLPNKTVYENVAYALEIVGASGADIKRQVPNVLALVNLYDRAKSYPNQLSGGELQRVAIARAVVNKPKLLLADEPTGNLDEDTAYEIMEILDNINKNGTTVIMATHAKNIVDQYQKRVIRIDNGIVARDDIGGYYYEEP